MYFFFVFSVSKQMKIFRPLQASSIGLHMMRPVIRSSPEVYSHFAALIKNVWKKLEAHCRCSMQKAIPNNTLYSKNDKILHHEKKAKWRVIVICRLHNGKPLSQGLSWTHPDERP